MEPLLVPVNGFCINCGESLLVYRESAGEVSCSNVACDDRDAVNRLLEIIPKDHIIHVAWDSVTYGYSYSMEHPLLDRVKEHGIIQCPIMLDAAWFFASLTRAGDQAIPDGSYRAVMKQEGEEWPNYSETVPGQVFLSPQNEYLTKLKFFKITES